MFSSTVSIQLHTDFNNIIIADMYIIQSMIIPTKINNEREWFPVGAISSLCQEGYQTRLKIHIKRVLFIFVCITWIEKQIHVELECKRVRFL